MAKWKEYTNFLASTDRMKTFGQLLAVALISTLAPVALRADDQTQGGGYGASSSSEVRLLRDRGADPILALNLPWKAYTRPSIEVCLLPDGFPESVRVQPLHFVGLYLKSQVTVDVFHCLDRAENVPIRLPFVKDDIEFKIFGQRNTLMKPAVCVACRTESPASDEERKQKPVPRASFCLLEHWAGDEGTLFLTLPPDYFAASGKLKVWLLRGDNIVWSHTMAWPGIPSGKKAQE